MPPPPPCVSYSSSVVFWVTHLWSFWRAVETTARLSTLPMQTSEHQTSPSPRHTRPTSGSASWQDQDTSYNQQKGGLDGVTPPAAHCPCWLLLSQNQGGTSLVLSKERGWNLIVHHFLCEFFSSLLPKSIHLAFTSENSLFDSFFQYFLPT